MAIHFHTLTGCAPTPLASYLKALGILRLISEQADKKARGAWRNESLILATSLTDTQLMDFFLKQYAPTPLISPWNRGSGFLSQKDKAATYLEKMENSPLPRLKVYQKGIQAARSISLFKQLQDTANKKKEFEQLKPRYIEECRRKWRGKHLQWLETAVILQADGTMSWPSLLGTGGNDGRLDFTDNFRQRFAQLFDLSDENAPVPTKTCDLLSHALFGNAVLGTGDYAIGQYSPGAAGGANSSDGLDGKANVNPWDFILFFEGTILFASAASRRLKTGLSGSGSAPFALMAQPAGHPSSSTEDKAMRGEQWMPLWHQFSSLNEIRALLGEGRAQLGRSSTRDPVEMARAVARLGTTRGILAFERFGYLERNGQANFAIPLGRRQVCSQPHQNLLNDLDEWLVRLHRKSRGKECIHSLVTAVKNLNEAILAATADAALPLRWQNILIAVADIDQIAEKGGLDTKDPSGNKVKGTVLRDLSPGWIAASDDGSPEFRLSVALACQYRIRRHWLPLNKFGRLDDAGAPSVVCHGRNLIADCIAFINRRLIESSARASRAFDQTPARQNLCADLRDIAVFLQGGTDHHRLLRLARAFMALDIKALGEKDTPLSRPKGPIIIDDAFTLFRLCLLPEHQKGEIPVRADIFRRLSSGDMPAAVRLAAMHLRAHGITSPLQRAAGNARLLAASLAFPLSRFSHKLLIHEFSIENTITNKELEKHES
ncbi:type I-U CRISPR-associated protein Csx17 [uncultured Desulfobacter sp.]|uniref:type I-G CRISPR-associated protein Cas8g1/Csx17 n=1 Tax=uncultured Desulfobacter sp. TaxID=240139 RepID=UPI002AAB6B27|nr:type I-U CRISPR-associated protein Csx17 [uncultured Desulfobacter sp.]